MFWKTLSYLVGVKFDPKVGNYCIMSRRVVRNFRLFQEQLHLVGGIVEWMGFRSASIDIRRSDR